MSKQLKMYNFIIPFQWMLVLHWNCCFMGSYEKMQYSMWSMGNKVYQMCKTVVAVISVNQLLVHIWSSEPCEALWYYPLFWVSCNNEPCYKSCKLNCEELIKIFRSMCSCSQNIGLLPLFQLSCKNEPCWNLIVNNSTLWTVLTFLYVFPM